MKLKVSPVTRSQPSHSVSPARTARPPRPRANQSPATPRTRAAGISHPTWVPTSDPNIRNSPVAPHWPPVVFPPPTEPVSEPLSRPKPL